MPNRFYRPTPTQYTSQFVAEQYPFDAMLALEEKKLNRADDVWFTYWRPWHSGYG